MAGESPDRSRAERPCPICGKPPSKEMTPFCSKRCADIDLHKWLHGAYAVPGEAEQSSADDEEA